MAEVLNVRRKMVPPHSTGPEWYQGMGTPENTNTIEFLVDLHEDGSVQVWLEAHESDHTGIIAEWNTGSATTLIEAAMVSEIQSYSQTDHLSATQRTKLPGKKVTWPAP
jgi:hypothetical protein